MCSTVCRWQPLQRHRQKKARRRARQLTSSTSRTELAGGAIEVGGGLESSNHPGGSAHQGAETFSEAVSWREQATVMYHVTKHAASSPKLVASYVLPTANSRSARQGQRRWQKGPNQGNMHLRPLSARGSLPLVRSATTATSRRRSTSSSAEGWQQQMIGSRQSCGTRPRKSRCRSPSLMRTFRKRPPAYGPQMRNREGKAGQSDARDL